jgi:hypothetical protein
MNAMSAREPASPKSATVQASLMFAERTAEKPFVYGTAGDPPAGAPKPTATYAPHSVTIENARPIFDEASLDTEGFAFVRQRSAVRDFWDEAQTLALGHPEAARLVKDLTGASRVVVFDNIRRRRVPGARLQP